MSSHILPFSGPDAKIRLMFEDEAGFGRINKPRYCWCFPGLRPTVPCHYIREYRYVYEAVEPLTGESCFIVTNGMRHCLHELLLEASIGAIPERLHPARL